MGDFMRSVSNQLAASAVNEKDNIIREAINSVIGNDWVIEDVAHRGKFKYMPDGTEVFSFDGVDLVRFMKPKTNILDGGTSMSASITQEYQFLNV